jgi:hypothetical protein
MRRRDAGGTYPRAAGRQGIGFLGALLGLGLWLATAAVAADEPLRDLVVDHVAALKGRTAIPAGYAPVALASVAQLPIPALRTEADIAALAEVEHHAVTVTGYVTRVLPVPARVGSRGVTPWEFYVHLRVAPPPACEYHDDPRNVVAVVTPPFQPPHTEWDFDVLADLCGPATRVRVSGWLLYDPFSRPQVGRSRLSPWSIHPVTQLEVWNARDRAWDRLP